MKSYNATIQMKATEQYFPVVPLITLYKVVLTFESVGEILKCDHSNETSLAILSHSTICFSPLYKIKFCGIITLATFASKSIIPHNKDTPLLPPLFWPTQTYSYMYRDPYSQSSHRPRRLQSCMDN